MQNRNKLLSRLALVLVSLIVLELVLIRDQVQPVKAIKKKILLKKLKKMLPLLALIKPKKKLILVPVPIPMFNKHQAQYNPSSSYGHHQQHMHNQMGGGHPMSADGSTPPMTFVMEPGASFVGATGQPPQTMQLVPMSMTSPMLDQAPVMPAASEQLSPSPQPPPMTMLMPSLTMTLSSNGGGATMSAIELTPSIGTSTNSSSTSGALMAAIEQQQQQQQQQQQIEQVLNFDEQYASEQLFNQGQQPGGEYYYTSPWSSATTTTSRPRTSPAKLLRDERLRQTTAKPPVHQHREPPPQPPAAPTRQLSQTFKPSFTVHDTQTSQRNHEHSGQLKQQQVVTPTRHTTKQQAPIKQHKFSAPMPIIMIKNQWRPFSNSPQKQQQQQQVAKGRRQYDRVQQQQQQQQHLTPQQEQQIQQALEIEELVPVGPPQLMPIYQTPNGRLHMTPPTMSSPQQAVSSSGVPSHQATTTSRPSHLPSGGAESFETTDDIASNHQPDDAEVQTLGNNESVPQEPGRYTSQSLPPPQPLSPTTTTTTTATATSTTTLATISDSSGGEPTHGRQTEHEHEQLDARPHPNMTRPSSHVMTSRFVHKSNKFEPPAKQHKQVSGGY